MHHNLLSALAMFLNSDPSFRARAPTAEDRKCITSLNCHHCSIEQWGQCRRVGVYSLLSKQYFQLFLSLKKIPFSPEHSLDVDWFKHSNRDTRLANKSELAWLFLMQPQLQKAETELERQLLVNLLMLNELHPDQRNF